MLGALARRLFGSANDRYVKSLGPIVLAVTLGFLSDVWMRSDIRSFSVDTPSCLTIFSA